MKPEEINRLVADKVMGWVFISVTLNSEGVVCWNCMDGEGRQVSSWDPYHRIEHAWMVVEKMQSQNISMELYAVHTDIHSNEPWSVRFFRRNEYVNQCECCENIDLSWDEYFHALTAPATICLAALRALGVDVEEE